MAEDLSARSRRGLIYLMQVAIAVALLGTSVYPGMAWAKSPGNVRKFMVQPGSFTPFPDKTPRQHKIQAKGASGTIIDVPATAVDVFSGVLSWEIVDPLKVSAFTPQLPNAIRPHVSLFYMNQLGWIVVPRGWHLHWAAIGADGNTSIAFVSPKGWRNGWMYEGTVPSCWGCIWDVTRGLTPAAYKAVGEGYKDFAPPAPTLVPTPKTLVHPNRCIAIFSYQPKALPLLIRAIVQMNIVGDPWERELYIAVPPAQETLARYILNRFRTEKPHPTCAGHIPEE